LPDSGWGRSKVMKRAQWWCDVEERDMYMAPPTGHVCVAGLGCAAGTRWV
jgi:hypothetical protein